MVYCATHRTRGRLAAIKVPLEAHLGTAAAFFAYPYGMHDDESTATSSILGECGYISILTSQHGTIKRGAHPLRLPRIKLQAGKTLWMFKLLC